MPPVLLYTGFVFGAGISYGIHYLNNARQQKKYPMKMIVFKTVGEGTPKMSIIPARIDGKYIIGKKIPGIGNLTKPRFQWNKQISDDVDISLWKSNFNIYAVQIEEKTQYKLQSVKTKIYNKDINIPWIKKETTPKHVALREIDGKPQPAEEKITKEGVLYSSVNYNLFFPKENADLKAVIDDSIADVMIQLIEDTAERFTWKDKWEQFGIYITMGAIVMVVILFFIFTTQGQKNLSDALTKGVKVAVEISMKTPIPITTTPPPLPITPPPF